MGGIWFLNFQLSNFHYCLISILWLFGLIYYKLVQVGALSIISYPCKYYYKWLNSHINFALSIRKIIYQYRRSPHFVIFGTKRVSWNSGITNFETLFSTKSQIGSKIFLKSTFLANFLGNFFLKFQIFYFSFAYFFKSSYLLLESNEVLH